MNRAEPGETVYLEPGEYPIEHNPKTVRSGEPGNPITITGPEDAVLRSAGRDKLLRIKHDHVHLTGLTFDGLRNPTRPGDLSSYGPPGLIMCIPPRDSDDYLEDIVIAPRAVGNARRAMIVVNRAENVEIGGFEVIGLAGAHYVLTGTEGKHAGEIVYLGTPPTSYGTEVHPWTDIDETRNVHVHHVDNSAGHPHSEIVNAKLGTRDVLVEYCTDGGGSQNTEPYPPASVHLQSYEATVRWCTLLNEGGYGVYVNAGAAGYLQQVKAPPISMETVGTGHEVYGNRIDVGDENAVEFYNTSPADQTALCGNTIDGQTRGDPTKPCPGSVPPGDGTGHLGGDTPWTDR